MPRTERGPRARTRRLMLDTASRLMQAGATPSVSEVAEAAGVSRATAYRYFPSQAALVQAVVDEGLGPILTWRSTAARSAPPRRRTARHVDAAHRGIRGDIQGGAEAFARPVGAAPGRHAWRSSRSSRAATASTCSRTPSRRCKGRFRAAGFERLAQALSLVFGVEVLIVLKDIWGLDGGETQSVAQWAASRLSRRHRPRERRDLTGGMSDNAARLDTIWFDQILWKLEKTRRKCDAKFFVVLA